MPQLTYSLPVIGSSAATEDPKVRTALADIQTWANGIIRGRVAANGTIQAGTGFTVLKTDVGEYTVTFSVAFAATPIVVATSYDTFSNIVGVTFLSTSSFNASITMHDQNARDSPFSFIAMAP